MKSVMFYLFLLLSCFISNSQVIEQKQFSAGFKTIHFTDSTRIYKPDTQIKHKLHYRPIDLDIWYPSDIKNSGALLFKDLFELHEKRANEYQNETDYTGFSEELILYMAAGFGVEATDGKRLLNLKTNSYLNTSMVKGEFPVVLYMAGYNGMGWENYHLLEKLAENGFIVISISSIGTYPGDMTNGINDTMEQVYDAEYVIKKLTKDKFLPITDANKIGIIGMSWGGMSSAILLNRNPNIGSFISMDGSDIFYFGESEEEDDTLNKIYEADLLHPEKIKTSYMFIEAGDRLSEFNPTSEYHYYKKINGYKKYLRFINSKHEDFSSMSWALKTSSEKMELYENLVQITVLFFQQSLKNKSGFENYYKQLLDDASITNQTYQYNRERPESMVISGKIRNANSKELLPYVNIGVLGKEFGTVSNKDGAFELEVFESTIKDTLIFSSIGFKPINVSVESLLFGKGEINLEMQEAISELDEIVLTTKSWKYKSIGNNSKSTFIGHLFYYDQLGKEMGIRMNVGRKPLFVESFNFHISYNRFSAKSFFRLNMYKTVDGKPSHNILQENIIIPVNAKQTGMVSIDLNEYDIVLSEDVITTLEWIDNEGEVKPTEALVISVGLMTGGTYERNSKQAKMKKKLKGMGLGFTLDVRY